MIEVAPTEFETAGSMHCNDDLDGGQGTTGPAVSWQG
jgi:hypothetical protein